MNIDAIALRVAFEFSTDKALKKYLKDHPKADKSLHSVVKTPKHTPEEEKEEFETAEFQEKEHAEHKKELETLSKSLVDSGFDRKSVETYIGHEKEYDDLPSSKKFLKKFLHHKKQSPYEHVAAVLIAMKNLDAKKLHEISGGDIEKAGKMVEAGCEYGGGAFGDINTILRDDTYKIKDMKDEDVKRAREYAENLQHLLPIIPKNEEDVVYRGFPMTKEALEKRGLLTKGTTFSDSGFLSTSTNSETAENFSKKLDIEGIYCCTVEIHGASKKGYKFSQISGLESEGEVLFPPNSPIKITDVEDSEKEGRHFVLIKGSLEMQKAASEKGKKSQYFLQNLTKEQQKLQLERLWTPPEFKKYSPKQKKGMEVRIACIAEKIITRK